MSGKKILHIFLWLGCLIFAGLSYKAHGDWIARGGSEADSGKYTWMIYGLLVVACIAVWFFTKEKEEDISITRG